MANIQKINLFIGAGASASFGFPLMDQLTKDFDEMIEKSNEPNLKNIYRKIVEIMNKIFDGKPDIESIMSVIIGLKDKNHLKENLGDFALYILHIFNNINIDKIHEKVDTFKIEDLELLETKYKEFIRGKLVLDSNKVDRINKIYDDFFGSLHHFLTNPSHSIANIQPYSKVKKSNRTLHQGFNIFTTNYDTSIEKYFFDKIDDYDVYTGGVSYLRNPDRIIEIEDISKTIYCKSETHMNLIKLHGSVNWIKNINGDLIQKDIHSSYDTIKAQNESGFIKDEILIYPISQKQIYISPFIQFFSFLEKELKNNKFWIIIGYSFRDIIIRNMFEQSIESIEKIILIHPDSKNIKNLFNQQTQEKILTVNRKFGGDDFKDVNKHIANLLKDL